MTIPVGKLPREHLERLLAAYHFPSANLTVGPAIGEDAAAIDIGDRYLLVKTDPITFVTEDIGRYAIQINANDIACMGGKPLWFLSTILLPDTGTTPPLVDSIFRQISEACSEIGVALCGGHTEITEGIRRPLVIGVMLGEADKNSLIRTSGAQEGDDIILTKSIAIEGTSIIAREKRLEMLEFFGADFTTRCRRMTREPGLSVLKEAAIATECAVIHAMHDPTEGGLSTGLVELAIAADVGIIVYEEKIPVLAECREICDRYSLNPLGLIASGSLLITLEPDDSEKLLCALLSAGIPASRIGRVLPKEEGINIMRMGRTEELPRFTRDELTRIHEK